MDIRIDPEKCTGCGQCMYLCPAGVLAVEDGTCRVISEGCMSCGNCEAICPVKAVSIEDPIMKRVDKKHGD